MKLVRWTVCNIECTMWCHQAIKKARTYFFSSVNLEEERYGCNSFHAFKALALYTPV